MEYEYESNLYEDFMKKHLSHYGYYTGKNELYRARANFTEWNSTYGYVLSDGSSTTDDATTSAQQEKGNYGVDKRRTTQLLFDLESDRLVSRLRQPRHLFTDTASQQGPQQLARWPAEIEVIDEPVKHINPPRLLQEPFYQPDGLEQAPDVQGTNHDGTVVFELKAKAGLFFQQSRVGGSARDGLSQAAVTLSGPEDTTLVFESRFESGNLERAVKVGPHEYELWMRNDLYTNKHTQWFYFRVSNTRKDVSYRFTICNFTKTSSLYSEGMRPLSYSVTESAKIDSPRAGWHRTGGSIKYYKTNVRYLAGKTERSFYALTFTTQFLHDHDTVYFAHCYPYTYTDLQDYLCDLLKDEEKVKLCKLKVLCRTLAGNLVYVMTITSPEDGTEQDCQKKKAIVITARVHPGETNSSWMMKGIIDYLLSNKPHARHLRDRFVFKIVPMLNPDGVIVGNYRCSLSGRDLNRNYSSTLKDAYPAVWHTKQMIQKTLSERGIMLYCDLHGHSKKQNVFIYGCENRAASSLWLHERVFPAMLGHSADDHFNYDDCNFKVQKSKEGTGRVTVWNMGVINSYTMEATFCGGTIGKMKNYHYTATDFEQVGNHFCDTLVDFCDPDKYQRCLKSVEQALRASLVAKLEQCASSQLEARVPQSRPLLLDLGCTSAAVEQLDLNELYSLYLEECRKKGSIDEDEGSNSSDSDGLPMKLEYMQKLSSLKKKRKTKKKVEDKVRHGRLAASSAVEGRRSSAASRALDPKAAQAAEEATIKIYSKQRHHQKCRIRESQQKLDPPKPATALAAKNGDVEGALRNEEVQPSTDGSEARSNQSADGSCVADQTAIVTRRGKQKDISLRTMTNAYLTKGLTDAPQPSIAKALPHFKYSTGQHGAHVLATPMVDLCSTASTSFNGSRALQQLRSDVLRESAYTSHLAQIGRQYTLASFRTAAITEDGPLSVSDMRQTPSLSAGDVGCRSDTEGLACTRAVFSDSPYQIFGRPLKQHPPPFDASLDACRRSELQPVSAGCSVASFLDYRAADDCSRARQHAGGSASPVNAYLLRRIASAKKERAAVGVSRSSVPYQESSTGDSTSTDPRGGGGPAEGRYLDDMVKQTDAAIRYLTDQIEGMQRSHLTNSHDETVLEDTRKSSLPFSHEQMLLKRYQSRRNQESAASSSGPSKGKRFFL